MSTTRCPECGSPALIYRFRPFCEDCAPPKAARKGSKPNRPGKRSGFLAVEAEDSATAADEGTSDSD
jgi:hypothetical protein